MNKKWKRILSMVLALAIIVTMLPTSGLRAEAAAGDVLASVGTSSLIENDGTHKYLDIKDGAISATDLYTILSTAGSIFGTPSDTNVSAAFSNNYSGGYRVWTRNNGEEGDKQTHIGTHYILGATEPDLTGLLENNKTYNVQRYSKYQWGKWHEVSYNYGYGTSDQDIYEKKDSEIGIQVRHYSDIIVDIIGTDAGSVTYNGTTYTDGQTIKFYHGGTITLNTVEGYNAPTASGVGVTPTTSGTLTVTYTAAEAAKHNVTLIVNGDEYGDASLSASGELAEGTAVTLDAAELADTNNADFSMNVSIEGATLTGDTFTVGTSDVTVTVTFSAKVLNGKATANVEYNSGMTLDQIKQEIFNKVVTGSVPEGVSVNDVKIQYYPYYENWGMSELGGANGYESLRDLTVAASENTDYTVGGTNYYSFAERGEGATEKVRITWGNLYIEANITLVDTREEAEHSVSDDRTVYINGYQKGTASWPSNVREQASALTDSVLSKVTTNHDGTPTVEFKDENGDSWQTYASAGLTNAGNVVPGNSNMNVRITYAATANYPQLVVAFTVNYVESRQVPTIELSPLTYDVNDQAALETAVKEKIVVKDSNGNDIKASTELEYTFTPAEGTEFPTTYTVAVKVTNDGETWVESKAAIVFTVVGTLKEYTVTWVNEDGTVLYTDSVGYGETPVYSGATPTKAADAQYTYTHNGWTPEIKAVDGEITYTATYSKTTNVYIIGWDTDGDGDVDVTAEVPYGTVPEAPAHAEIEDKSPYGWSPEIVAVTGPQTYTAQFSNDDVYEIKFVVDGSTYNTQYVNATKNEKVEDVADPVKDYAVFGGWTNSAVIGTVPTGNVVLEATWLADANNNDVADEYETATITVTVIGNGSVALGAVDGTIITDNSDGTYTVVFDSTVTGADVITVTSTPNDTTATDGAVDYLVSAPASVTVADGANVAVNAAFATVSVEVAETGNVYINGSLISASKLDGLKNKVLTAALGSGYNAEEYTVYMVTGNGNYDVETANGLQQADMALRFKVGDNQNFIVEKNANGSVPAVSNTITVSVKDSRYILTVNVDDVAISAKTEPADVEDQVKDAIKITYDDPQTEGDDKIAVDLSEATINMGGYVWPEDGQASTYTVTVTVRNNSKYQETVSDTAILTVNDTTILYTVTYTDGVDEAEVFADQTTTVAENLATPGFGDGTDPVRDYYTFAGWTPSVEPTVTDDVIYTATWTINNDNNANNIPDEIEKYTVVYDFAGGVDANGNTGWTVTDLAYGAETPTIANPTRDGFYFKGWDPAVVSTVQTPEQGITITYTATWSEKCTITFVYGNGTENTATEVEAGETVSAPAADPTREDYLFLGWYLGDVKYDFTAQVTDSITLTAKWAEDFNGNDIDDATEAHYDIVYVDGFGNELKKFEDVLVGLDTPVIADPAVKNYKFNGWDPEVAQIVTANATYTAQWLNDANNNKVDDALETITVVINGNGAVTVNGESVTTYLYDSTGDKTITVVATPVVEGGLSKTYVSAVAVDDVFAELTYNNRFAATASFTADGSRTVTVTFTEAGFVLNDDRLMNYYDGMIGVKNEDVYDIIVDTPEYADATEITLKYKAREAMTHSISVDSLDINDTVKRILKLAIGDTLTFDMDDLWLDVNVEVEGQVKDSVSLEQAVNANLTSEKLNGILDAFKTGGLSAAKAELDKIIAEIYNSAMYYGAHNFGYNATGEETVTEEIKITYKNDAMYIECETDITLKDMRAASFVVGENVELIYRDYTDEDLAAAIGAYVTDANGNTVEGAVITSVDITDPYTFEGKNVSEVAYEITFKFAGNEEYKPSEAKFTVTVKKAPITVFDAPNVNVFYGEEYSIIPEMTLGNKYGQEKEVTDSLIQFIIGLDISDLDVDQDGVHGLNGKIQLILTPDLQKLLDIVAGGDSSNKEMSLSQLTEYLQYIDDTSVDALKQALNALSQITEMGDITIVIGDELPTNIGAYLHGSVTTSANYETAFDVGYLLIKPRATEVYLDFNYNDTNGVFTPELLQHVNLGASAYDEEALTTLNADATALVNNVFFGIDTNGELVATLFNGDVDPENIENELGNGAYTQLSFIAEFGNEFYYAVPIVRAFVIMPNTVEVEIVDNEGTEFNRTFDNAEQTVDVELNYTAGTLIVPSEEYLTVTYSGVQTNGKTWNSETAPTHAGAYVVTAIYVQRDDKGEVIAIGADVQPMVVKPAETATTVEDLTVEFGTDVNYVEDMVTVETSSGVTMPDMTVITGSVAVDGDIVTAGWDAVEGNVNIDFPDWVDDVLKEHAPSIYDGMTASEFTAKVIEKVPGIIEKIEAMIAEYGIEADITQYVDTLVAALDEVKAIVDQLPVDVNLTFDEKLTEGRVGVYLVAAVVTDSDHMPSADMGILVIEPSDDLVVDIKDTTVTYNGQEQMPDVLAMIGENYVTTDMVYVIINEELNANLILEDDAQALLDLIAAELGVEEVPESITLGELKAALEGIMSDIKAEAADSSLAAVIAALGITKEDIKAVIAELETKVIGYLTEKGLTAESGISLNAAKPVDAGIYKVCGLAIVENYIPQLTEGTLVIKPKEVTVTVADAEKTYGDADPEFTYEVEGLVEGDELDVTVSREEGETVGEYTITADYVENKNYVVTVVDGTLTINPKDVTVTVDSASKVYGDADPKFTATVNGLVGEDKLEISYSRETGEDVGEYAITATVADNKNYDVTVENTGKLTINPKEITAADVALDGTLVYNGSEQTQGVKITDGITYDVTGNTGNDAGDYTLTVTGNGNYTGEVELSWTIAKAEVVITVSDMEMVITDPVPELQYQVAVTAPGAVTAEQLGVQLSVDTDGKTLGEFDIEVIYTESDNWTVTVVDGKLTVGLGDYVCWNMQTGKYYAELSTALKEADDMDARTTSVETIQMLKDCTESYIMVTTGTTLDLNGFKVTSRFVAAVDGAHIIDSKEGEGRLITGMDNVTLDEQNLMLPVYDKDAYIFVSTKFALKEDKAYTGEGFMINASPAPALSVVELLKDGAADNNLQVVIRLTWDTDQGVKSQDFAFTDDVVAEMYSSNRGTQLDYGKMFEMVVTGIENVKNLKANVLFVSGTDAEISKKTPLSIN